tara:strand:+ start:314 stop:1432 length:1119 start_codon:yes stop_codon:yes gene_type:complete
MSSIVLKGTHFPDVDTKEIVEQIEAKKKCENKLPTWFHTKNIYFPNKLNIEQTSSEITAAYKSNLIQGNSLIDITGGFGVDCCFFSKQFEHVIHCEIDENLSNIVNYNNKQLKVENVETQNTDGIAFVKQSEKSFDWIYADPSRRHENKGKVFFLNDCLPNIPENLDTIFAHTNNVMIKTSPLLDLSVGIKELKFVKTIHVIAVNNEVKELLWVLEKGFVGNISILTVNITKESTQHFNFLLEDEKKQESTYKRPLTYLYEPNAAILKAGAFNTVAQQLGVFKLQKHSHLYTSDTLIEFPGRRFIIQNVLPYNIKLIKKLEIHKANITTRNFVETVQQIRKRLAINEGGNLYLFFTTDNESNKIVIITTKNN